MMKSIRVLAISLTLGVWATVSVEALNAKQIAQSVHSSLMNQGIVDRASDGTINLVGTQPQQTVDCNGNAVHITSNNGKITLQGTCSEVVLVGNENRIQVKTVGKISVTGNDNQISWRSGINGQIPEVSRYGHENVVWRTDK